MAPRLPDSGRTIRTGFGNYLLVAAWFLTRLFLLRYLARLPAVRRPLAYAPTAYFCPVDTPATIIAATLADAPALARLINQAYRGAATPQGWTTESQLFEGPRLDEAHVREMALLTRDHHATLLKYVAADGQLLGCVYLEPKGKSLYLSTLAVAPAAQAQGVGRQLLAAAEAQARRQGSTHLLISVLSARPELLAWYERHGYQRTGQCEPFPATTAFGRPRQPLVLVELELSVG